ncbi:MAG: hypothetical protein HKO48_03640, partial [Nitrosopumilus sp.]|nr:hypothetical protein [Nitrosopumilus sp.]
MNTDLETVLNNLKKNNEKIDKVSKQLTIIKHEYRSSKDSQIREEIKKKWDNLQKEKEVLEKEHRKIT